MARAEFTPEAGIWSENSRDDGHFRGGVEVGKIVGSFATMFASGARNGGAQEAIPSRLARVIPAEFSSSKTLGAPGASDVFVTAAADLRGLYSAEQIAMKLTLIDDAGKLIPGPRTLLEFDRPDSGLASPVFRNNPGFVGRGRTADGASEFVLPNMRIDELKNVTTRTYK